MLFNDVKLSGDGKWSCASCHLNQGHTNNKTYIGLDVVPDGDPKGRSTPTLWGAGTLQAFSWAGTAPSLQANIRGIIVNRMKGAGAFAPGSLEALEGYVRSLGYPPNPQPERGRNAVGGSARRSQARLRGLHAGGLPGVPSAADL